MYITVFKYSLCIEDHIGKKKMLFFKSFHLYLITQLMKVLVLQMYIDVMYSCSPEEK